MTVPDRTRLTDEAPPPRGGFFLERDITMKPRLLCGLLLLAALLLSLPSCAKKELLYSIEDGDRTIEVLGGSRASYLSVKKGGEEIWQTRVYSDHTVGNRNGTYGFRLMDLNFDGRNDLVIAITADGDEVTEQVFLQTADGSYRASSAFEGKHTLAVDEEQELVFGFTHTVGTLRDAESGATSQVTTDRATAYSWQGSGLEPRRYVALTFYGANEPSRRYCYSVADFDETTGAWESPYDRWMSQEEYEQADFEGLYYFRNS